MKKFLVLVDIQLIANGEYRDSVDNVYIRSVEAESKDIALKLAESIVTPELVESLSGFSVGYDFHTHVEEIC